MTRATGALIHASAKLGPVPYDGADVILFPQGLPGFEHLRRFLVVSREECAPFAFLASLEDPDVALPILPLQVAAGEAPAIPVAATAPIQGRPEDMVVAYAVVAIGEDARALIANLRAPVLINLDARRGAQVILSDETLPVAAPVGA